MPDEKKDAPKTTAAEKAADPMYHSVHADDNPKDAPIAVVEEESPVEGGADEEPTEEAGEGADGESAVEEAPATEESAVEESPAAEPSEE